MKKDRVVFAIDPGTGVNSACGIAVLAELSGQLVIVHLEDVWPRKAHKSTMSRIRDIVDQVEDLMSRIYEEYSDCEMRVAIESFVMRGKGGETLQRFIGAVLTRVPGDPYVKIHEIQNTTMKKFVGGTGKADKELILKKVLIRFPNNELLLTAAAGKKYDSIDAIGIGLAALEE